jgi:hypothetical protein
LRKRILFAGLFEKILTIPIQEAHMDNDNRIVDLLVDLLYEAKEARQEQFAVR